MNTIPVNLEQLEAELAAGLNHVQSVPLTRAHWSVVLCALQGMAGGSPRGPTRELITQAARQIHESNHFEPSTERFLQERWEGLL